MEFSALYKGLDGLQAHTQELIYRKNKRSAHVIVFLARKRRLNKKFGVVTLILDEWCSLGDLRGRKKQ